MHRAPRVIRIVGFVTVVLLSAFARADPAHTFFHGHSFTAHPLACAVAARFGLYVGSKRSGISALEERFYAANFRTPFVPESQQTLVPLTHELFQRWLLQRAPEVLARYDAASTRIRVRC